MSGFLFGAVCSERPKGGSFGPCLMPECVLGGELLGASSDAAPGNVELWFKRKGHVYPNKNCHAMPSKRSTRSLQPCHLPSLTEGESSTLLKKAHHVTFKKLLEQLPH